MLASPRSGRHSAKRSQPMGSRSFLSVELPADEKKRWQEYCRAQKRTPSAMTRLVIGHLLNKHVNNSDRQCHEREDQPDYTRVRMELRLTHSELEAVKDIAKEAGASPNQWVANLVRSYITRKPQLGMEELAVIAESNARLLAIGRNLNQIARALNKGEANVPRLVEPSELADEITAHVKAVSAVIRSNLERWSVTWQ